ncbi:MerR family transcriptional regulator [Pseudactinotalea sp. Z1748]|uniref:MerR family transcriptional regulator n=1 Tax=Pseudactinotalea sp. Z1748 TaxID=3413027 RepID=UPI003C79D75F
MEVWLSTGTMSRRTGLSIKALRLYHDSGLLVPARVEEATGYRRYTNEQVETGRTIGLLRRAGMPLEQIARVLVADPLAAREQVLTWLTERSHQDQEQIASLHRYAVMDAPGAGSPHQARRRKVGERVVAALRADVSAQTLPDTIMATVAQVRAHLRRCGAGVGPEYWVCYLDPIATGAPARIETCVPYAGAARPAGAIMLRAEPAGTEIYVPVSAEQCRYPQILPAYAHLYRQAAQRGGPVAPPREIYPVPWPSDPRQVAAEVAVRVASA